MSEDKTVQINSTVHELPLQILSFIATIVKCSFRFSAYILYWV